MTEEILPGGGTTRVVRIGDTVRRPHQPWSPAVHALLRHLRSVGFDAAPESLGRDEQGRDVFGFLPGEVGHYPWSAAVASDAALVSAAELLRRLHDATASIAPTNTAATARAHLPFLANERRPETVPGVHGKVGLAGWRLPAIEPVEVLCHNDFAPYNCVYDGSKVRGIIDFDFAVPGPRSWDLAHALYRFVPLSHNEILDHAHRRATLFLDAYGAGEALAGAALDSVVPRLRFLVDFMTAAAEAGDENFAQHIARGDRDLYLRDIDWVGTHRPLWTYRVR